MLLDLRSLVRPSWRILGWTLILVIVYLSLTPAPINVPMEMGDKFEHVLAYATLMLWFANLYELPIQRAKLATEFVMMGILLEFIQRWSGFRSFEVADMIADAVGVATGWAIAPPRTPNCLIRIESLLAK